LTVVQLASVNRTIPYDVLLQKLDITNLRELEDLIIECMYVGLLEGKLDQEKHQFQVDQTIGRDVRPGDIDNIISKLTIWQKKSESQIEDIQQKIQYAVNFHEDNKKAKKDYQNKIDEIKANIKNFLETTDMNIDTQRLMMEHQQHLFDPMDKQRKKKIES